MSPKAARGRGSQTGRDEEEFNRKQRQREIREKVKWISEIGQGQKSRIKFCAKAESDLR